MLSYLRSVFIQNLEDYHAAVTVYLRILWKFLAFYLFVGGWNCISFLGVFCCVDSVILFYVYFFNV